LGHYLIDGKTSPKQDTHLTVLTLGSCVLGYHNLVVHGLHTKNSVKDYIRNIYTNPEVSSLVICFECCRRANDGCFLPILIASVSYITRWHSSDSQQSSSFNDQTQI
jgi:hypothetical protein